MNTENNRYKVEVVTELGCSIQRGEYSVFITEIIEGNIGQDDFKLVREAIEEDDILKIFLPAEGVTEIILLETGEREDVFWHKYYEVQQGYIIKSMAVTRPQDRRP